MNSKLIMIKKNIANLENWLTEKPKDEDYLRLLETFKNELVNK